MRKHILEIPIDWISETELETLLKRFVASQNPHHITTVNPEFVVLSQTNPGFKAILQQSDLSLADGTGIVLAQTFLDAKPPKNHFSQWLKFGTLGLRFLFVPQSFTYKRITGVALTHELLRLSSEGKWRVFLLGAAPGVAQAASTLWQEQYPELIIAGASSANPDDPTIIQEIKQSKPDILLVAYGAPKQEVFIAQHAKSLHIPIMVGVGGTFDYAVGTIHRGPRFIQAIGLEWLMRLLQQPKRFKRIYRSTIIFMQLMTAKK